MEKAVVYSFETRKPIVSANIQTKRIAKKTHKKYRVENWTRFIVGSALLFVVPPALLISVFMFIRVFLDLLM